MIEQSTQTALWTPGWYELDQSLAVGERQKFWFFQHPPDDFQSPLFNHGVSFDLVFFNQLDSNENSCVRYARVLEMTHPRLGSLLRIDTDGQDYIFYPVLGEEIVVNAEETPGTVYDSRPEQAIQDWSVVVKLEDVSEPLSDTA
jgi:hypothetical protein